MPTVFFELPEALAERLEALPLAERNQFAVAALEEATRDFDDTLAGIQRGIEDIAAGREFSLEEARERTLAEFEARLAAHQNRNIN
jgi:predicted transcriptional regulator